MEPPANLYLVFLQFTTPVEAFTATVHSLKGENMHLSIYKITMGFTALLY